jgi:hypothetical protein
VTALLSGNLTKEMFSKGSYKRDLTKEEFVGSAVYLRILS